jgi:[acyl-carrier-protein] S-malonyltransferase
MSNAFVFPGQGSQAVGMGTELAQAFGAARLVLEEVDEALGERLSRLMKEGPESELTLTANAQPAIMAVSIAVARVLEAELGAPLMGRAAFVAGHSLGEWSALVAAGALPLDGAARLLRLRGRAMQEAVPAGAGAMTALLGAELDVARAVAEEAAQGQVCGVANDNGPGQIVLSGDAAAIERAEKLAPAKGVKRCIRLTVSAPFHCALMKPAAERVAEALDKVTIAAPAVPLIANVTAEPVDAPALIRGLLVEQVTSTVRWREGMLRAKAEGVGRLIELGQGKVLSGLVKRIDRDLEAAAAATPAAVDALLKSL